MNFRDFRFVLHDERRNPLGHAINTLIDGKVLAKLMGLAGENGAPVHQRSQIDDIHPFRCNVDPDASLKEHPYPP
jgi:hypothetical protein